MNATLRGVHVVAVEPFPKNVALLRENLKLNNVENTVTIIESGLSSHPHSAELILSDDEFDSGTDVGNATVAEGNLFKGSRRVKIELNTLDNLWPGLGNPRLDVIKVDIEGHEDRFLEGAVKTLSTFRPVIFMEVNRWFYQKRGLDFDRLIPSLLPSGYRCFSSTLTEITNLANYDGQDVLFIPEEKIKLENQSPSI